MMRSEDGGDSATRYGVAFACIALFLLLGTISVQLHLQHEGGGVVTNHHESTELSSMGCRCTATADIHDIVTPSITGGGTWDVATITTSLTTPCIIQSSTPSASFVSGTLGIGTGGTALGYVFTGSAMAGLVKIRTGTTVATTSRNVLLFSVTFTVPYATAPRVFLMPGGSDSSWANPVIAANTMNFNTVRLAVTSLPYIYSITPNSFQVWTSTTASFAANTNYAWSYIVIG